MSKASELIKKCELQTGQRVDDLNSDAMTMLFGAMARIMNDDPRNNLTERDDFATGVLVKHQISTEAQQEKQANKMFAKMLASGISPDTISQLLK